MAKNSSKPNDHLGNVGTLLQAPKSRLSKDLWFEKFKKLIEEYCPECAKSELASEPNSGRLQIRFAVAYTGEVRKRNYHAFQNWFDDLPPKDRGEFEGWLMEGIKPKHAKKVVETKCEKFDYSKALLMRY